jgi:hypothetical protein
LALEEIQLFGVPVARTALHETPALREQYLPEILRRYEANAFARPHDYESDRIHTSFGAADEKQVLHPMPAAYRQLIRKFIATDRFHAQIWHSVYWSGREYQERRHQLPGHVSFLHFLSFDASEHKRPIFYSPAGLARAHCLNDATQHDVWSEEAKVEFYEGDALVFPSYVEHCILAGEYKNPMVIVSMNVTVAGQGEYNGSTGNGHGR